MYYSLFGINLDSRATHNFIAHADEVVSEVILREVYGAEGVCSRINTRNPQEMENGIIRSEYMQGFGEFACMWNAENKDNMVLFHIFPSIRGGFMGETVKIASGKFADIVSFAQEDKAATPDAIFVHPSGFLCQAETEEGVTKMIESAIESAMARA